MAWTLYGADGALAIVNRGPMTAESLARASDNLLTAVSPQGREGLDQVADAIGRAVRRWAGEAADSDLIPPVPLETGNPDSTAMFDGLLDLGDLGYVTVDSEYILIAVPPGSEYLEVRASDPLEDSVRVVGAGGYSWGRGGSAETNSTFVMLDGFVGATTERTTGLHRLDQGDDRISVRLGGAVGVFVGTLLRVVAKRRSDGTHDPSWARRLSSAEATRPAAAAACPRIEDYQGDHRKVAVFVHGTASNGVAGGADLQQLISRPVFRFEHDTWRPIAENASALGAILANLAVPDVLLVGHSRGGLVARVAAAQEGVEVSEIVTLGTPHKGTPLADGAEGLLSYATVVLGQSFGSVVVGAAHAAFIGGATAVGSVPEGWSEMRTRSGFIQTIPYLRQAARMVTFGGEFGASSKGLGVRAAAVAKGASRLLGASNDLVVSTTSSILGGGDLTLCEDTDHFSYLSTDKVMGYLLASQTESGL